MDPSESGDPATVQAGTRLTGSDAIRLHLTLAFGVGLCMAVFGFELTRALGGNSLSWAYVFEWPLFAVFAVYMWWNTLHQPRHRRQEVQPPTVAPEHVEMLKAWQEHRRRMAATEADSRTAETEGGPGS